jgi:hypothetical protein
MVTLAGAAGALLELAADGIALELSGELALVPAEFTDCTT